MKTVAQIISDAAPKAMLFAQGGPEQIGIHGTPEGFRLFAEVLLAQADGRGGFGGSGSPCICEIPNSVGFLRDAGKFKTAGIFLHCHEDYFNAKENNER